MTKAEQSARKKEHRARFKAAGICLNCYSRPICAVSKQMCAVCAEAYRRRCQVSRHRQRLEVIEAYGGKCVCCGEAHPEFLTVDHVFNDGAEERKTEWSGTWYAKLKKLGWPKDRYQLLCWNCNSSKGIHGYCPHQPNSGKVITADGYSLRSQPQKAA